MKYIPEYSKRGLVNLLAEKICKKLNENEKYPTVIEVVDCVNFYVIKGYTSNTKVLNLTEFKDEFLEEQKEFLNKWGSKKFNFIDVIDYKNSPELDENSQWFEFWNSNRPVYNKTVIDLVQKNKIVNNSIESIDFSNQVVIETAFPIFYDDIPFYSVMSPINISSNFPFGYSLNCGKTKYYYCEYICYQLFTVLNTNKILFKISKRINEHGDLDIEIISDSEYNDEDVKSMILDIFDFNLTKFQTDYLKDYDFMEEIKNPFEVKPWINKDRVRELMIV